MSEELTHGGYTPAPSRHQPAYGDGRLAHDEPATIDEHMDRPLHATFAVSIFVPVLAAYLALGYGVYRAVTAIF